MIAREWLPSAAGAPQPPRTTPAGQHRLVRALLIQAQPDGGALHVQAKAWVCGEGLRWLRWRQPRTAPLVVRLQLAMAALSPTQSPQEQTWEVLRVWRAPLQADVDPLHTVPSAWWCDSERDEVLAPAFAELWALLPQPMRAWFHAIFWNHPQRWWMYLHAGGSLAHHHARPHGLFQHSLDCAQRALRLAGNEPGIDRAVLVLAALLHDLGKAGEYEWHAGRWRLSLCGELIGHRLTTLQWMSEALLALPEALRPDASSVLGVHHAIHASHAPDWVGLRRPRTPEAMCLGSVDALSGHLDWVVQLRRRGAASGAYVPALKQRLYWSEQHLSAA